MILACVRKDEERVRMVLQEAGDNWSLHTQQRPLALQAGVNDVEVFAARGKQHGIVRKRTGCLFAPAFA